jgi:hypothetical protein
VEQVFNSDQAMGSSKEFQERSKALVGNFRNKWRYKHLLYQVFLKGVLKDHLSKVYKIVVL